MGIGVIVRDSEGHVHAAKSQTSIAGTCGGGSSNDTKCIGVGLRFGPPNYNLRRGFFRGG